MELTQIIQVLVKRWWLIAAGALVAGAVALALSLLLPRTYEAEAMLLISKLRPVVTLDTRFPTVAEENMVALTTQDEQVRRQTLIELATSPQIASLVLDQVRDKLAGDEQTVSALSGMVKAGSAGNVITFQARADSPAKAAAVANAWAQVYAGYVNRLYSTTSPTDRQVQAELANARAAYEQSEVDLEAFIRSSTELELTRQVEQKKGILAGLQAGQLDAARRRVDQLLERADRIDQLLLDAAALRAQLDAAGPGVAPSPGEQMALYFLETGALAHTIFYSTTLELGQPVLIDDGLTIAEAIDEIDRLVDVLQATRAELQAAVAGQSSGLLAGEDLLAVGDAGSAEEGIAALQAQISALEADLRQQTWKKQALIDDQALARDTYMTVARKAAEVQLLAGITGVEVQVAARAPEPDKPAFPRPLTGVALGLVAGALAGLALAFLVELTRRAGA